VHIAHILYTPTETTSGCTLAGYDDDRENFHVGIPYASTELMLKSVPEMNYTVKDVINGVRMPRGEVCVRGLTVFRGYYKDPEKTQEAFIDLKGDRAGDNDWFQTGDIGMFLPTGALRIIDRKKNIFKLSQGEYIAAGMSRNLCFFCCRVHATTST
jgi:long-chain acyl-CoA synthetase